MGASCPFLALGPGFEWCVDSRLPTLQTGLGLRVSGWVGF